MSRRNWVVGHPESGVSTRTDLRVVAARFPDRAPTLNGDEALALLVAGHDAARRAGVRPQFGAGVRHAQDG